MLRYWAMDLCRSWSKRIAALFIVLSMLLSDLVTFAEPNGSSTDTQTLICGRAEHQHTDACYEIIRELTCVQEESEGHIHTAECYAAQNADASADGTAGDPTSSGAAAGSGDAVTEQMFRFNGR